jgi:SHS2 domain-containing protein
MSPAENIGPQQANPPSDIGWEHFAHDADIGVCGWGPSPEKAFEQAALALTRIVTDQEVRPLEEVKIVRTAPELDLLLVEWLNAIIFEMATRSMVFGRFEVSLDGTQRLAGRMWGEKLDVARHLPAVEPKGATYTALRVARMPNGRWIAACVIDV